jgi:hypothetical protein
VYRSSSVENIKNYLFSMFFSEDLIFMIIITGPNKITSRIIPRISPRINPKNALGKMSNSVAERIPKIIPIMGNTHKRISTKTE